MFPEDSLIFQEPVKELHDANVSVHWRHNRAQILQSSNPTFGSNINKITQNVLAAL